MAMKLLLASEPSEQEMCQINEEFYLLGHNAVYSVECQPTLNMEVICSSETSFVFEWTMQRFISQNTELLITITV
jgi:hypothetical protein